MSKRSRLHRPNIQMIETPEAIVPENHPRPHLYHPCGLCMKGGGTLKKLPTDIVWIEWKGRKIRMELPRDGKQHLYEHTSPRFCQQWWVPKRFFKIVDGIARKEASRERREFHEKGRISRDGHKKVAFQRKSV